MTSTSLLYRLSACLLLVACSNTKNNIKQIDSHLKPLPPIPFATIEDTRCQAKKPNQAFLAAKLQPLFQAKATLNFMPPNGSIIPGNSLWIENGATIQRIDPQSGVFKEQYSPLVDITHQRLSILASGRVIGAFGDSVVSFDPVKNSTSWEISTDPTPSLPGFLDGTESAAQGSNVVISQAVFSGPQRHKRESQLLSINAEDGKVRWHQSIKAGLIPWWLRLYNSEGLLLSSNSPLDSPRSHKLLAFDPNNGQPIWEYEVKSKENIGIGADRCHVVIGIKDEGLVVLDTQTGKLRYKYEIPDFTPFTDIIVNGDTAYFSDFKKTEDGYANVLTAFNIKAGGSRWSREYTETGIFTSGFSMVFLIEGEELFYMSTGGVLHALDINNGQPTWEWGLGESCERLLWVDQGERRDLLCVGYTVIAAFTQTKGAAPEEEATVEGKVTTKDGALSNATLSLGDTPLYTDRDGHYKVKLKGRGTYHFGRLGDDTTITTPSKTGPVGASLTLNGSRSYVIDLFVVLPTLPSTSQPGRTWE